MTTDIWLVVNFIMNSLQITADYFTYKCTYDSMYKDTYS